MKKPTKIYSSNLPFQVNFFSDSLLKMYYDTVMNEDRFTKLFKYLLTEFKVINDKLE